VLNELKWLRRKVRRQEELAEEISLQRLSMPNGPQLERIQRYETTIKRDTYRAMDRLERLQRPAPGASTPPNVNVNVSNDDGD
jgi:hypothetical protein